MVTDVDVTEARRYAARYRACGMNVLPAAPDAKRPMTWELQGGERVYTYKRYWDEALPAEEFERYRTTNLQVVCGRRWGLLVMDLDGEPALQEWQRWSRQSLARTYPRPWISRSGSGHGYHLWYTVPDGAPLPKGFLWKGTEKHQAIERLCDHSLVMAPPSRHPVTGERYLFLDHAHSPNRGGRPALAPAWLLRRPLLQQVARTPELRPRLGGVKIKSQVGAIPSCHLTARQVLDAIPDKRSLAQTWGLEIASSRPTADGWYSCYALDRPDRVASASFHADSGVYRDHGTGAKLLFFDLAVACGLYARWQDAVNDLGRQHHA